MKIIRFFNKIFGGLFVSNRLGIAFTVGDIILCAAFFLFLIFILK